MSGTVGIVLTGGASRRMGVDKATMQIGGKPMVVRVADALWEAGLHPVEGQGGDIAAIEEFGLSVGADPEPGAGPLAGIHAAMQRHPDRDVVFAACDLVDIDIETIQSLVDAAAGNATVDVVVAAAGGRRHLLSWWRAGSGAKLANLLADGTTAYLDALEQLDTTELAVAEAAVRNVNTPDDVGVDE